MEDKEKLVENNKVEKRNASNMSLLESRNSSNSDIFDSKNLPQSNSQLNIEFKRSRTSSLSEKNPPPPTPTPSTSLSRRGSHDGVLRRENKFTHIKDWTVDPKKIKLGKKIGEGAFGKVYKADYLGTTVCVKIGNPSIQQIEDFEREIEILSSLRHPNVVLFMGVSFGERGELYLIQEYVSGGALNVILKKYKLPLLLKIKMAHEIALALNYLHYNSLMHRDLKGENILLDDNSSIQGEQLNFRCKVADFGLATLIDYSNSNYILENVGSVWWRASEVLTGKYTFSADIFSFGVVLGEIILEDAGENIRVSMTTQVKENGRFLFLSEPRLIKTQYPEAYQTYPKPLLNLMEQCCNQEPKERPSSEQAAGALHILHASYKKYILTVRSKIADEEGVKFWLSVANPHFSVEGDTLILPSKSIVEGIKNLIKTTTKRELDANQEEFLYQTFFQKENYHIENFSDNFWSWFSQIYKVIIEKKILPLWSASFIQGFITKESAYKLLESAPDKTFIVRFSSTQPLSLVFSCKFENKCSCILVQVQNSEFKLKNRIYNTISELLRDSSLHEMVNVFPNIPWNGSQFSIAHSQVQSVLLFEDIKRHVTGYKDE